MDEELGIGKRATIDFNNYLREVCVADLLANPLQIGDPNMAVEVDESLSGGKTTRGVFSPSSGFLMGGAVKPKKI